MKKAKRLLALLLCIAMVISLFGCAQKAEPTEPPTEPEPTDPPATELYHQAKQPILDAENLELELSTKKQITVGADTFTLLSEQELTYSGLGTDSMQAALSEELEMSDLDDEIEEYFSDGTLYTTVYDEYHFKGAMTQEEYLDRFAPAVLLDEKLYAQVSAAASGSGQLITFDSPTAAESWALPEDAQFLSASGTALINSAGTLEESTYTIEYRYGAATITQTVTAAAKIKESVELTPPAEDTVYTELSCIEFPRLYDMAVMYICSTQAASSSLTETLVSQAAAYMHTEQTTLEFYGANDDHVSDINYTITAYQNGTGSTTYTQQEHFQDGAYSLSVDNSDPQAYSDLTASEMYVYCQTHLAGNILSLEYVASVEASEAGGIMYYEVDCTEAWGNSMNAYVCSILYEDPDFLNNMATDYVTTDHSSYIAIDPYTGFPTALGSQYIGTHTIDGAEYILSIQSDQTLQLASPTAYESITGEALAEEAPETKATPLFYHVTGSNGQEMWLLGTIHVGDEHTAYLPQEIYDAFDASDALAVECDIIAFEEAVTTDLALMTQISAVSVFTDGTTTKSLLDEQVYEDAVKLMKISGSYNSTADLMKPAVWSQSIEDFYLKQSYALVSEKGVDMRLLKLAKEKGMEILEVESGMAQLQMFTGFSNDLQILMLEEALNYTCAEYIAEIQDLYEKWCQGDEAVLREAVKPDLSGMTEEELALYEEHNKAMIIDRNTAMLDVAKGYLEGGSTVFYAVGLAHLLQDNGLVDTLREAGYTVELVTYG